MSTSATDGAHPVRGTVGVQAPGNTAAPPWFHTLVGATGDVYPCCMGHRELPPLGNVRRKSLVEIFADEPYRRFRREMLAARKPICHHCDDFLRDTRACNALLNTRLGTRLGADAGSATG